MGYCYTEYDIDKLIKILNEYKNVGFVVLNDMDVNIILKEMRLGN